jgi:heme/copper-type cytochrome/quinol oxidase subunit 2
MSKKSKQKDRSGTSGQRASRRGPKPGGSRLYLRLGAFVLVVVVVGVAVITLLQPPGSAESAGAVPVRIDMSGFEPATLQAKAGTPVKLRLVNPDSQFHTDGNGKHQFAIPELGVDTIVQPKSEQVITFTPTQPGTYTFYCDVCCGGKENPSMRGTLTVAA